MTTAEKLNLIEPRIKDKEFLEKVRGGHIIPFYILDYDPRDEGMAREHVLNLQDKINKENCGIHIKVIDLYKLLLECLQEKGYLEKALKAEESKGTDKLFEGIKNTLGLKKEINMYIDKIRDGIEPEDVIFLTGVGNVYPIVRTHKVLSNLRPLIKRNPLIVMYPGTYINNEFSLFGEIDRDYYQAFKLILEGDN
ncbi:DUF1788 domain-containing protein [Butyrivibrio sp. NC2007]|uniref:DUF1788 domain-containing protein n=1 Tax=Butyrivibrio sp. NC2007 TaxID=1280683 RepID=UPI0003B56B48|nr:DUF1788 domain-containing protein [Butyrivibrio sp. NC2007]